MSDLPPFHTGHGPQLGTGLMQPASKFSPQITCTQVHLQHRGCWRGWPSGSWVNCVGCPTQNRFQAREMLKPRRTGLSPWELTLPEPLLNALQKGKMISLKFFLFWTYTLLCTYGLSVLWAPWNRCQSIPQYLSGPDHGKNTCSLSSKYYFHLLPDMPLTISYSQTWGIWLFEGNRWVWAFLGW